MMICPFNLVDWNLEGLESLVRCQWCLCCVVPVRRCCEVDLFFQQMFDCLLFDRHCARSWEFSVSKTRCIPTLMVSEEVLSSSLEA